MIMILNFVILFEFCHLVKYDGKQVNSNSFSVEVNIRSGMKSRFTDHQLEWYPRIGESRFNVALLELALPFNAYGSNKEETPFCRRSDLYLNQLEIFSLYRKAKKGV